MRLNLISVCTIAAAMLFGCGSGEDANPASKAAKQLSVSTVVSVAVEPQNGWWWNPAEGGRGFAIERQGNQLFLAAFLYETNGAATWYASTLTRQTDGSYSGALLRYAGGQTLLGSYKAPANPSTAANATLTFNTSSTGSLIVKPTDGSADRTIALERFPISTPAFTTSNGSFESGWWWNEAEGGRGYFIEVQGSKAFVGSFMYDGTGQPVWYVSSATVQNGQSLSGSLQQYANGQSLTGNFKPATPISASPGAMAFNFSDGDTANIVLPDGKTVPVKRFVFNPAQPTVAAAIGNCYKVNTDVVRYHLGFVSADGTAFATHRFENIPLSGFGLTGTYRVNTYIGDAVEASPTEDQELMMDGLKPLVSKVGSNAGLLTTVTTTDGYMPFNLALNVEKNYTLQQHVHITTAGTLFSDTTPPQVMSTTLLEIGSLQTFGKYFPLTCKIKQSVVSTDNKPNVSGTYNILWFAPGYGVVKWDIYSPKLGNFKSLEVVSVEAASD